MRNNKGFTMVELLAVIVLVSLLITVAVPSVYGLSKKINDNVYCNKVKTIEEAARQYGEDYYELLESNNSVTSYSLIKNSNDKNVNLYKSSKITVLDLIDGGYLNKEEKKNDENGNADKKYYMVDQRESSDNIDDYTMIEDEIIVVIINNRVYSRYIFKNSEDYNACKSDTDIESTSLDDSKASLTVKVDSKYGNGKISKKDPEHFTKDAITIYSDENGIYSFKAKPLKNYFISNIVCDNGFVISNKDILNKIGNGSNSYDVNISSTPNNINESLSASCTVYFGINSPKVQLNFIGNGNGTAKHIESDGIYSPIGNAIVDFKDSNQMTLLFEPDRYSKFVSLNCEKYVELHYSFTRYEDDLNKYKISKDDQTAKNLICDAEFKLMDVSPSFNDPTANHYSWSLEENGTYVKDAIKLDPIVVYDSKSVYIKPDTGYFVSGFVCEDENGASAENVSVSSHSDLTVDNYGEAQLFKITNTHLGNKNINCKVNVTRLAASMLEYSNSTYTTCNNVQCALDELYSVMK